MLCNTDIMCELSTLFLYTVVNDRLIEYNWSCAIRLWVSDWLKLIMWHKIMSVWLAEIHHVTGVIDRIVTDCLWTFAHTHSNFSPRTPSSIPLLQPLRVRTFHYPRHVGTKCRTRRHWGYEWLTKTVTYIHKLYLQTQNIMQIIIKTQ